MSTLNENKITIGVINWDCSLPSDTFFGFHATKSLSPSKYRYATPYYADIISENKIDYHIRTQEEYDRELQYAIDCGIEYFAYCWYGESKKQERADGKWWHVNMHELSYGRRMHAKSKLREKIKMCAILGVGANLNELSDEEFVSLADEMKQDYYQKIDGRPLLYVYRGYNEPLIDKVNKVCKECGTPKPYVTFMCAWDYNPDIEDFSKADAVSAYSHVVPDVPTYDEFTDALWDRHEYRKRFKISIIPHFSLGYDPSPRIDNPVPWHGYEDYRYNNYASEEEVLRGAKKLVDWVNKNKDLCPTGHILTFAWNEFEEGAWICPTYNKAGTRVDTSRTKAFEKAVNIWKNHIK